MTSGGLLERLPSWRVVLVLAGSALVSGCGLPPPPPQPPFECAAIDRASERFPSYCEGGATTDGGIQE